MPEGIGYGQKAMKAMRSSAVKEALKKQMGKANKNKKGDKKDDESKEGASSDE